MILTLARQITVRPNQAQNAAQGFIVDGRDLCHGDRLAGGRAVSA